MKRPYTGFDGIAAGEHPHLRALVDCVIEYFPGCWNNGTYGVRKMRGKQDMSVHSTGRAADISWRYIPKAPGRLGKGIPKGGRKQALAAMDFLVANDDALGIEAVLDYFPIPFGRGWRCDRDAWTKYKRKTISGAPRGDWFHCEVNGKRTPEAIRQVFAERGPKATEA